jgi:hypothetical protein
MAMIYAISLARYLKKNSITDDNRILDYDSLDERHRESWVLFRKQNWRNIMMGFKGAFLAMVAHQKRHIRKESEALNPVTLTQIPYLVLLFLYEVSRLQKNYVIRRERGHQRRRLQVPRLKDTVHHAIWRKTKKRKKRTTSLLRMWMRPAPHFDWLTIKLLTFLLILLISWPESMTMNSTIKLRKTRLV